MTFPPEVISTEELVLRNPVYLQKRPAVDIPNGGNMYEVIQVTDGESIGSTDIIF